MVHDHAVSSKEITTESKQNYAVFQPITEARQHYERTTIEATNEPSTIGS